MTKPKLLAVAAAALVDDAGRVLMQRRPAGKQHAGLWELPGGKIEADESAEEALARELQEELAITVLPGDMQPAGFATAPAGDRQLLLLCFMARRWTGALRATAADALVWVWPGDTEALPMPPADRPLMAAIARMLE